MANETSQTDTSGKAESETEDPECQATCPSSILFCMDEEAKERFSTAVFTLATFAAVLAVYVCIGYSLSSSPTVMHQL
ncbi:uncharacterized protein LOC143259649 isoform X5 [Megalopta genalis]|uniref:uncharacterized protein LOC143259649 isoform X5 n=1 Tax=Megalopta genalis TaxID=115081 RepID=UPI003FD35B3A